MEYKAVAAKQTSAPSFSTGRFLKITQRPQLFPQTQNIYYTWQNHKPSIKNKSTMSILYRFYNISSDNFSSVKAKLWSSLRSSLCRGLPMDQNRGDETEIWCDGSAFKAASIIFMILVKKFNRPESSHQHILHLDFSELCVHTSVCVCVVRCWWGGFQVHGVSWRIR